MIRLVWIILIGLVLSIHIQSERDQERNIESQLVFFDEFDGNSLDLGKWDTIPRWGRTDPNGDGLYYYADDAIEVSGGVLRINAEKRRMGGEEYTSGLIETDSMFSQLFGYFEIRAKLPKGQGFWPAFWMLQEGIFPPEIDVFEALGDEPNNVYLTHHWADESGKHQSYTAVYTGPDFTAGFHTYAIKWTENEIIWYVDGVERQRTRDGVPQEPMYLIASLAIGGVWPGEPDQTTRFPNTLEIDYVRVYSTNSSEPAPPDPGVQYMSFISGMFKP